MKPSSSASDFPLPLLDGDLGREVAQRVVGGGLIGDHVDLQVTGPMTLEQRGEHLRRVADDADREALLLGLGGARADDRVVEVVGDLVAVALGDPALEAGAVHVNDQAHPVVQRHGQRLGAAHAAAAAGEGDGAGEGAAEALLRDGGEGLKGALEDALGGDVDPGPGGHLAVHHQTLGLELAELGPGRPVAHEVGVREQHAGRPLVRAQHADGLAGLDQEGLVLLEVPQGLDDRVEGLPGAAARPVPP